MPRPKVKMLVRNPADIARESSLDLNVMPRNLDPSLHPFEEGREYIRALNATKLERVFAKPFLGSLEGHTDGVRCLWKHPRSLSLVASGSYDGELRLWDLPTRRCVFSDKSAHKGFVRSITSDKTGAAVYTCGDDRLVKRWSLTQRESSQLQHDKTYVSRFALQGMDHHRTLDRFVTCGEAVHLYDPSRAEPIRSFQWGPESVSCVRWNPIETDLIAGCSIDRSVLLYDSREIRPLRRVVLTLRANAIAWNPLEAMVFTVASEDYNLYTFDLRDLSAPLQIHKGHVSAVMDVDYSPTGLEFVSAGYDKMIRIFELEKSASREVYHSKRQQRVLAVSWSLDNNYILSASDEMNIRLWKAQASSKIGLLKPREKQALNYANSLKQKFQHHPQIKRIARHRHVPKFVIHAAQEHRTIQDSRRRKDDNRRKHSTKGPLAPLVAATKKVVVREDE